MASSHHEYTVEVTWTGDRGTGTSGYRDYGRDHILAADGKATLPMSSDPAFRGDQSRWNPEEVLVGSLSSCHMLWFLHLASQAGVVVRSYRDQPTGRMVEDADGGGRFEEIVLRPHVMIDNGDPDATVALHHEAHLKCFIANSVNFPVRCEPSVDRLEAERKAG